tara:strand:+ start:2026 stop:2616 length:591 start_codon:yes stop_codon:yes gene_type:complete
MEVKQKKLRDYVVSFENVIPKKTHNIFKKIFTDDKILNQYEPAKIVRSLNEHVIDRDTRPVDVFDLWNSNNYTNIHWKNLLIFIFKNKLKDYITITASDINSLEIKNLEILRYDIGGKYIRHTDHTPGFPRVLSLIYFINDNYSDGDLEIYLSDNEIIKVKKIENSLVIFPSCHLYPHAVKPVTKGIRYSIVSWAY